MGQDSRCTEQNKVGGQGGRQRTKAWDGSRGTTYKRAGPACTQQGDPDECPAHPCPQVSLNEGQSSIWFYRVGARVGWHER